MKAKYYDPLFYIPSDKMPFNICLNIQTVDPVDPEKLARAVNTAIRRYPYFAIRVVAKDGEYLTEHNDQPVVVYPFEGEPLALGSEELNGHFVAAAYRDHNLRFYISHVITDGAGSFPFVKTALYYYFSDLYGTPLDAADVNLADSPFYPDETGNPYPEDLLDGAEPFYRRKPARHFRLTDGGHVCDHKGEVFYFKVNMKDVMKFSHDNDGSPCALLSSLMTKAIWDVHPDATDPIVSSVSFNMRPALQNRHNYRMLCSWLGLSYPNSMRPCEVAKLCTCSRGMVTIQSQPENVWNYVREWRDQFAALDAMPSLEEKKALFQEKAVEDSTDNTFSISYVGKLDLGCIAPYITSWYNITDGATYQSAFLEVFSIGEWFHIALIQGFSSDIYYRALLRQLKENGLAYEEVGTEGAIGTPKTVLP